MTEKSNQDKDTKSGRFLPGNTLAFKHGAYSLRQFRLPVRGVRALERHLAGLRAELETETERTAKNALLIAQVIRAEEKLSLIDMWIKRSGIIRLSRALKGVIELQPAVTQAYTSMLNVQRLALQALGSVREPHVPTIAEIAAEYDKKQAKEEAAVAPGSPRAGDPGPAEEE
jgi:hypothetical protein